MRRDFGVRRLEIMNVDTSNLSPKHAAPIPSVARTRLTSVRTFAGYGVAIVVSPYLGIKIAWTLGLFLPTEQMGEASWRAINGATAVLAGVAILLAMAFCRPWGERLPAGLVALPVWVGTGLLVPMVLLAPALGPAAIARDREAGAADIWAYEQVLVMVSLVGIGVGLPLALAGYARARWPEALSGPLDVPGRPGNTRLLQCGLARAAAAGCIPLGLTKIYWSAGGPLGLDAGRSDHRDVWWHLLSFSMGAWALVGAWGLLVLTTGRGARGFLPPMVAAWVSSGVLFSQNLYGNLSATRSDAQSAPERALAHVLTSDAGIALGVLMATTILLVLHDRRGALRGEDRTPGNDPGLVTPLAD
jgi:hypothetical protein